MRYPFLKFCNRNIVFCDVGARWGVEEPWKSNRDFLDVVSFEPDQREFEELNKKKTDRDTIFPYALFKEEKQLNLNLTKSRGASSIYEPNRTFLERFPDAERFTIDKKEIVHATTLDVLYNKKAIENLDFIKLDTQGAELDIMKGGVKLLEGKILGVQVEVEFRPLYKSQPLFSDIDIFIRDKLGLELVDIRKAYWKYKEGYGSGSGKGQIIFADALYFRDPYEIPVWCEQFEYQEARNKIITACFMGVIYGYPDYSLCLLERPRLLQWLKVETIDSLKMLIRKNGRSIKYKGKGQWKIWEMLQLLSKIFEPDYEGWATGERHLGTRKKFGIYY